MDYRALGELVFFSLIGLSVLTVVTALSFHFVLRPFLEKVLGGRGEQRRLGETLARRLERVEGQVVELESELGRVRDVQEFQRQLGSGGEDRPDRPTSVGTDPDTAGS